ncbi:MAG: IS91 family transposase, partial [Gemmatimonadota bacterium]
MTASAGETAALPFPQTTPARPDSSSARRARRSRPRRTSSRWATLLARIYYHFPLVCPRCGQSMRLIAFLTDPSSIRDVLRHLEEPVRPPRVHPARGPPE